MTTQNWPKNAFLVDYTKWCAAETRSAKYRQLLELTEQALANYQLEIEARKCQPEISS